MWDGNKPILKIEILEAVNLELLDSEINPFLVFVSGETTVQSKIGETRENRIVWTEKLSLILDPRSPISVSLFTAYDEENIILDKVIYQFSEVAAFKRNQNIWVTFAMTKKKNRNKLNIAGVLKGAIERETGNSPQLNLNVTFLHNNYLRIVNVYIDSYRILLKGHEAYTVFFAKVLRNDGEKWVKALRYSAVKDFKDDLEDIELGLKEIDFPGKTYFEFLSCVWPQLSRFDPRVIEKRKKAIQEVLNYVVKHYQNIEPTGFNILLSD